MNRINVLSLLAMVLLSFMLMSCGGQPLDLPQDKEKEGPGLISDESGMIHLIGKPAPEESDSKKK